MIYLYCTYCVLINSNIGGSSATRGSSASIGFSATNDRSRPSVFGERPGLFRPISTELSGRNQFNRNGVKLPDLPRSGSLDRTQQPRRNLFGLLNTESRDRDEQARRNRFRDNGRFDFNRNSLGGSSLGSNRFSGSALGAGGIESSILGINSANAAGSPFGIGGGGGAGSSTLGTNGGEGKQTLIFFRK